jgi:hypothetical protein
VFALRHAEWARDLVAGLERAKTQGFLSRAIPEDSRESLLEALRGLAVSLGRGLPAVTKDQEAQLREAIRPR